MTLTTTRMLVAMVVVKVVMLTVMILMVMTRRMTMTTTKYGLRNRGHEFLYRLISRKKNRSRLPTTNRGSRWVLFGAAPKGCGQSGVPLPGYWKGIGDRFGGVLVGYWWVLVGIGGYWRRAARDGRKCGIGANIGNYI